MAPASAAKSNPTPSKARLVLPTPMRHDLENTGKETLRAVAFFAAAMFTQEFDQVMLPPKSHILGHAKSERLAHHLADSRPKALRSSSLAFSSLARSASERCLPARLI